MDGMSLWKSIVQGVGLTIGAQAAREAMEKVEKALDLDEPKPPKEPTPEEKAALAKAEKKAAAKRAKERAAAEKKREREIDAELKALKKKVGKAP
jgi:hypothetical protein